jgi:hypothetical protein
MVGAEEGGDVVDAALTERADAAKRTASKTMPALFLCCESENNRQGNEVKSQTRHGLECRTPIFKHTPGLAR